ITGHDERVPDCRVFAAEPVKREPASFLIAHLAQLVQESHCIKEPNPVLGTFILEIKVGAVTWPLHLDALDLRVFCAAHSFGKTAQSALFTADRPVVTVAANRDDPLLGVGTFQ